MIKYLCDWKDCDKESTKLPFHADGHEFCETHYKAYEARKNELYNQVDAKLDALVRGKLAKQSGV